MLDVLDLLPVPGGLLQGLDDQGRGGGNDVDLMEEKKNQDSVDKIIDTVS